MSRIEGIDRALVIRAPHAGRIVDGTKTWEMRTTRTSIRGRIGIIEGGTGTIIGAASIADCVRAPGTSAGRRATWEYHRIDYAELHKIDRWRWAWVLRDAERFEEPIPYTHPRGAVIWVSI